MGKGPEIPSPVYAHPPLHQRLALIERPRRHGVKDRTQTGFFAAVDGLQDRSSAHEDFGPISVPPCCINGNRAPLYFRQEATQALHATVGKREDSFFSGVHLSLREQDEGGGGTMREDSPSSADGSSPPHNVVRGEG